MPSVSQANELAVKAAGTTPDWIIQEAHTGAATLANAVSLQNAVKTLLHIALRADVSKRTVEATITYDGSTTYTVTIDGNSVATVGNTDAPTTLSDMADDINADGTVGLLVVDTAIDADGDGTLDTLQIVGIAEEHYSYDVSVSGGSGTITGTADPSQANARVYLNGRGNGTVPTPFVLAYDGTFDSIDYRGLLERFDTAGCNYVYVELYSVDGTSDGASITYTPTVSVGPCSALAE